MDEKLTEAAQAVMTAIEIAKDSGRVGCAELARADVLSVFDAHDAYKRQRASVRIRDALMGVR